MGDTVSFAKEIQQMLRGFGDVADPLLATAQLIERILLVNLSRLWNALCTVAADQSSPVPTLEHFFFLARKSPNRAKRLLKYLSHKRFASNALSQMDDFAEDPNAPQKCKKLQRCLEYVQYLDPNFTLDLSPDETDYRRMVRADQITRTEGSVKFHEYVRARHISFGHGKITSKTHKFWEYMNRIDPQRLRTVETVDMMAFVAFEMVAELVDLALLLRRELDPRPISPTEIREVCRRLQSNQGLPGGLFVRMSMDGRDQPIICF